MYFKMIVFGLVFIISLASAAKLDNTYLPPSNAPTAGGSGNFLQTPYQPGGRPQFGGTPSQPSSVYGPAGGTQFGTGFNRPSVPSIGGPSGTAFGAKPFPQPRPQVRPTIQGGGTGFIRPSVPSIGGPSGTAFATQPFPQPRPQVQPTYPGVGSQPSFGISGGRPSYPGPISPQPKPGGSFPSYPGGQVGLDRKYLPPGRK